ncbi:MAG: hypothetical protein GY820_13500 [Gammaproteobacteria bacterium]|nr:hypothetical protein [Gammaproteobacteria bacterium]
MKKIEREDCREENFDEFLLDEDREGERDEGVKRREGSLCEISLDRMENRQEKVQWNWRKRKKLDLMMEEVRKMEDLEWNRRKEKEDLDLEEEEWELDVEDVDRSRTRMWTRPKKLQSSENIIKV